VSAKYEYKLCVVEWLDAWFSTMLSQEVNLVRQTAGWLIQNNKRVVRIALTIDWERGPGDMMNIPRSLVRSIKILDSAALREEKTDGTDECEPSADAVAEAAKTAGGY
jgi:hypothetical protein